MGKSTGENEIFITDLEKAAADGPLSRQGKSGSWRAVDYETRQWSGVLAGCVEGTDPDPLTFKLGVQGWYKIHLGLYRSQPFLNYEIRVRLTDDLCCKSFTNKMIGKHWINENAIDYLDVDDIAEVYWKESDLTGQDLDFL